MNAQEILKRYAEGERNFRECRQIKTLRLYF